MPILVAKQWQLQGQFASRSIRFDRMYLTAVQSFCLISEYHVALRFGRDTNYTRQHNYREYYMFHFVLHENLLIWFCTRLRRSIPVEIEREFDTGTEIIGTIDHTFRLIIPLAG